MSDDPVSIPPTSLTEMEAFLDLTDEDRERLARFRAHIVPHMDRLAEAFYAFLGRHEPTARMLEKFDVAALRKTQRASLDRTLQAKYDADYMAHLEHVGRAHFHAGVSPAWFLGAYHFWQRRLHDLAFALENDPAEAQEVCLAIDKAFCLDMGLATEAHLRAYAQLLAERGGEADAPE